MSEHLELVQKQSPYYAYEGNYPNLTELDTDAGFVWLSQRRPTTSRQAHVSLRRV
jgi:hypothetical protein